MDLFDKDVTIPGKRKFFAIEENNNDIRGMVLKQYIPTLGQQEFCFEEKLENEYLLS